jgi:hypothetical protein
MSDIENLRELRIFQPESIERLETLAEGKSRLVQYTSAEAARSILENREVWLRNSRCMNDYMEIQHGFNCLREALHSEDGPCAFKTALEGLFVGLYQRLIDLVDGWLPAFRTSTFICSVSEHLDTEDDYGRLSMWRAYGGDHPVAMVLNPKPFYADVDLGVRAFPVRYMDPEDVGKDIGALAKRLMDEREYLLELGEETVSNYLFHYFQSTLFCVKHPGFKEEKEWRIVYNPSFEKSEITTSQIVNLGGIPQEIHKIALQNYPDMGLEGLAIPELIERIIIGPHRSQYVIGETLQGLLEKAGCENAGSMMHYSGIPLC